MVASASTLTFRKLLIWLIVKKKPSFFKRKGMPTPDASQFTQLKKYNAISGRYVPSTANKVITHLYQPVPSVTNPNEFLASFTNKFTNSIPAYTRINMPTGVHAKPKVPGGNVWGTYPRIIPASASLPEAPASFNSLSLSSYSPISYRVSSGYTLISFTLIGGGGAGGTGDGTAGGGGGGSGQRLKTTSTLSVNPGDTLTLTLGSPGVGQNGDGTDGGNTILIINSTTYTAVAGKGGKAASGGSGGSGGFFGGGGTYTGVTATIGTAGGSGNFTAAGNGGASNDATGKGAGGNGTTAASPGANGVVGYYLVNFS
jgi:hypothetical protein